MRWFDETHELTHDGGRSVWKRIALPNAGGIAEQDPKLMDALAVLKRVHDDLVAAKQKQNA